MKKHTFELVFLRCALKKITNVQNFLSIVNNFLSQYHLCLINSPARKSVENVYIFQNTYLSISILTTHFNNSYIDEEIICALIEGLLLMLCQQGLCFALYFPEVVCVAVL